MESRNQNSGGCGCILIILGVLGVWLFGTSPGVLIIIGIALALCGI